MKKIFFSFSAVIFLAGRVADAEDRFNLYMYVVPGPCKQNAFEWQNWSIETMAKLYAKRNLSDADVGYRLDPGHIMQPESLTNSILWFVVRATGKAGEKLRLSNLRFRQNSSDPGNTLENAYDTSDTNVVYSARALGVIWGENGERSNDTILDHGSGATLVDEIVFVGMQSTHYPYFSDAERNGIRSYLMGFHNFLMTASCEIVDESGETVATVERTLETRGVPLEPILSISQSSGKVLVGINMEKGRSAVIQSKNAAGSGSWVTEATVNTGDVIMRETNFSSPKGRQCYYRAFLQ